MLVTFYATLRQVVGTKSVTINLAAGSTVSDLMSRCVEVYPGLFQELYGPEKELNAHIRIFVNKEDQSFHEGIMGLVLAENDEIDIFPAIGGGAILGRFTKAG